MVEQLVDILSHWNNWCLESISWIPLFFTGAHPEHVYEQQFKNLKKAEKMTLW